jgi:hypothetical protein
MHMATMTLTTDHCDRNHYVLEHDGNTIKVDRDGALKLAAAIVVMESCLSDTDTDRVLESALAHCSAPALLRAAGLMAS